MTRPADPIDSYLPRVVLPYLELAPCLLVNTDLVFTTARHFAAHCARRLVFSA